MLLDHLFIPYKGTGSTLSSLTNRILFLMTWLSWQLWQSCQWLPWRNATGQELLGPNMQMNRAKGVASLPLSARRRGVRLQREERDEPARCRERLTGRRVVERRKGWWIWGDGGSLSRSSFSISRCSSLSLTLSPKRSGSGAGVLRELQKKDTTCPHVQQLFLLSVLPNSHTY